MPSLIDHYNHYSKERASPATNRQALDDRRAGSSGIFRTGGADSSPAAIVKQE